MKQLAVFASGTGSNFSALAHFFAQREVAQIAVLVCDHDDAKVLEKAERCGIPTLVVDYQAYPNKAAVEAAIVAQLPPVDLIVLAGFMRIIGPTLLSAFPNRVINLHPALLPSFPGRNGIGDAWDYGVKVTGVTVHYVDAGIDSGAIIAQQAVTITPTTTRESLEAQIHEVEHQLLPQVIANLIQQGEC